MLSRRNFLTGAAAAAAACATALPAVAETLAPTLPQWCPAGFLPTDGRAVSRTAYRELFQVIGTTFGAGDGVTTFNVPNLPMDVPLMHAIQTEVARELVTPVPVGSIWHMSVHSRWSGGSPCG
jgi:tail collar domain/TAT (twin-arginine translocation) pathway-exported protein